MNKKNYSVNVSRFFIIGMSVFFFSQKVTAQRKSSPYWEISANACSFHFSGTTNQQAFGISSEYFFNKQISVRGGFALNSSYFKFSVAPLMWNLLTTDNALRGRNYGHHYGKHPLAALAVSLFMSDGFVLNIPLSKAVFLTPYLAPMQIHLYTSPGPGAKPLNEGALTSAFGTGLKIYLGRHFRLYAGAEYNRTCLFKDARRGYAVNASLGYVFTKRR